MDIRIKKLLERGNYLFGKKEALNSLHQEISDHFYPERAFFTRTLTMGEDFAAHTVTSYPILCRRELGNAFGAMLRPTAKPWFTITTEDPERETNDEKRWLEWATGVQRRAMYDRKSQFVRATKEGDHDFAAFGQCVLTKEMNNDRDGLLFRCWHLRDVAWAEGVDGAVNEVHRKWSCPAILAATLFGRDKLSENAKKCLEKEPYKEIMIRHVVIPADEYEAPAGKRWRTKYVSIFFEEESKNDVLEEVGSFDLIYMIPRWQTVSGSQYAYSPAAIAGLPDARMIQLMSATLLEAGEMAVNPPMVATQDVVRSDMQIFAGGVTWVDAEYDEKLGEALRPLTIDSRGIPMGYEMRADVKEMIKQAFFLNQISMPPTGGADMTAFEVGQRVQEYIRNALPLFEPMEMEYNASVCEQAFELLLNNGGFGSIQDMPRTLQGKEVRFQFESPLHEAIERQKGQKWLETKGLLADAISLDPSAAYLIDSRTAIRDALDGIGTPAKWIRSEEEMEEYDEKVAQQQQAQAMMQELQQGAEVAKTTGEASQALGLGAVQ